MFDIGFWEIIIIAVVALLVVGPDKLPGLIREVAKWVATTRRFVMNTKREMEQELQFDLEKDIPTRISDLEDLDDLMNLASDNNKIKEPEPTNKPKSETSSENTPETSSETS